MMPDMTNNQLLLTEYLRQEFVDDTRYSKESDFFEYFSASQILKDYDLSFEEVDYGLVGAGNDGGCDGIYIFLNNILVNEEFVERCSAPRDAIVDLIIVQAKQTMSCGESTIMKWKTVSDNLLKLDDLRDYSARYNADVLDKFQMFRDLYVKLIRSRVKLNITYHYATISSDPHVNVQEQANELKEIVNRHFPSAHVTVLFEGADWFIERINEPITRDYKLILAESPITIGVRKDYIALVNLKSYFDFITDEDGKLIKYIFESNVRDYQGHNNVNNDIMDTLAARSGEDFWWLNNGVTILAGDVVQSTGKSLTITDPEIVNGLQTSTEVYNYYSVNRESLGHEDRNILVRVIVPESENSRDKIILATNSQTNIPKASLRATDSIHRQIEMYFKTRGLYYDRRKNYYKNQGIKVCDIVSVSFLAQCLITLILQKPNYARARPSTLLNDESTYNQLYVDNTNLSVFYKSAVLGKAIEKKVRKASDIGTTAKSDILFYVLYYVVAKHLQRATINANDIADLDISDILDTEIDDAIESVHAKYQQLGGTSMVAKGSGLISDLRNMVV